MTDSYSQDDVQEILHRAIVRQVRSGEFSRPQLLQIAHEIGLSEPEVQQAERDWLVSRQQDSEHKQYIEFRRSQFRSHLSRYLIINAFLGGLNLLMFSGHPWSLFFALTWGLGLSLDGYSALQSSGIQFERRFQKWQQRQQFKQLTQEVGKTASHLFRRGLRELQR